MEDSKESSVEEQSPVASLISALTEIVKVGAVDYLAQLSNEYEKMKASNKIPDSALDIVFI